ncbi:hypothetical protein YPPY32_5017, partial [Yersinia pestis PY-32]
MISGSPSRTGW